MVKLTNMTPDKSSKAHFFIGLEKLIKGAELLQNDISPYESYPARHHAVVFHEYKSWNSKVSALFKEHSFTNYLPNDFFVGERLNLPSINRAASFSLEEAQRESAVSKTFRKELYSAIELQIERLTEIGKDVQQNLQATKIFLAKNGVIWKEPKIDYFHKFIGDSKRLRLIKLLAKKKTCVATDLLLEEIGYQDLTTLSKEKHNINKLLKKKLDLKANFIIGERGRGYMINSRFEIATLKKDD